MEEVSIEKEDTLESDNKSSSIETKSSSNHLFDSTIAFRDEKKPPKEQVSKSLENQNAKKRPPITKVIKEDKPKE